METIYYSTTEVAKMLGELDSTIRFWCTKFKDFIPIKRQGSHRRFKEEDINTLKQIQKLLRINHFTIYQVYEHLKKQTIDDGMDRLKENDPIFIKLLSKELSKELSKHLNEELELIEKELKNLMDENYKKITNIMNENYKNLKLESKEFNSEIKKIIEEKLDIALKKYSEPILEQLKIEQEKNKQLTNILLELYKTPLKQNDFIFKKTLKKNLSDMF
ncbi:putative transcriptional regulator [Clostridium pasteurianum DSM 525 = ATCC 6013]|uniref:Putative transcriptional regulator n=1 Tax=Clostridium pasteurianum DSM 525 = ATCC 6013 TaxID=1262449 RepID=A0A0H3J9D9_CLOPA|nr:MerR family transcriptional regulator [Clostridium pasteurianum]AJA48663.1 putative transcriptional regulator [Clostridium pasteurianum DSM 525 = ATCC 6013]AJA52651.1 putative transcriptional regulator [Clostridium pasteurianum DSM 525 = ATCC 6013]AOZ75891.1 hypothetical protein AQ983_12610 [Clostridium pasteurianum DSM 525 = ATCC 6013]AOZ79687.1 hypothetical protein AQ984_12605 [Clostridium pasteurianum]ELP59963.1 hypothetical protein F502_04987 [Clostridium pasteurianum DSM 525 = ATCC 601